MTTSTSTSTVRAAPVAGAGGRPLTLRCLPAPGAAGIVHTSTHNNAGAGAGGSEAAMMLRIFAALQAVVDVARPRRLLFIAIDGGVLN